MGNAPAKNPALKFAPKVNTEMVVGAEGVVEENSASKETLENQNVEPENTTPETHDTEGDTTVEELATPESTETKDEAPEEPEKPEVIFKSEAPTKTPPIPKVKVKLKSDHNCTIGGEFYGFIKGKVETVPENVKEILARADLLLPL